MKMNKEQIFLTHLWQRRYAPLFGLLLIGILIWLARGYSEECLMYDDWRNWLAAFLGICVVVILLVGIWAFTIEIFGQITLVSGYKSNNSNCL